MKLTSFCSLLWSLSSIDYVCSIPFHEVNGKDLDGKQCPLKIMVGATCLPLCVSDYSQCPSQLAAECPMGKKLCPDGNCAKSCRGIKNICSCGMPSDSSYVACRVDFSVDIENFDSSRKNQMIINQCNTEINVNASMWQPGPPTSDKYWAVCPDAQNSNWGYSEPMWIAVFSVVGFEAILLLLWSLYKIARERGVQRLNASDCSSLGAASEKNESKKSAHDEKASSNSSNEYEDTVFPIKGFVNDFVGTFTLWSLIVISLGFIIYLSVLTADYYGEITGAPYGIAYESYNLSSTTFIAVWVCATVWYVVLNVFRARLRNYFRIECIPTKAHFIQLEQPLTTVFMLDDNSALLLFIRKAETRIKELLGWNVLVTTTALLETEGKQQYFNYQCTRYVFNTNTQLFQPFDFNLGSDGNELRGWLPGLSTTDANKRLERKGPNFISVEVPSFPVALAQEFTSFFYLYQLMIMWLFYYLAYWQVGVVNTVVIFISAIIKVIIRLKSERRIKSMAEHEDKVKVLRDNQWVLLSSSQLVPGDVFEVENGTTVPCDGVVLSGNIVADESSLTGEPLPIRKFPIKDEKVTFDRQGAHKINCLVAGTIVSQSTPTDGDGIVKALVYQTSTSTDKGQLVHNILFPSPISFIFDEQLKVVMIILCAWAFILFICALGLMRKGGTASWFYGMFCLSQVISPLLPAALVLGQSVAASQLRKNKIFCVDLPRIIIAGKVQIFCFDKTGTLTKEGLEFYGGQPTTRIDGEIKKPEFHDFKESYEGMPPLMQLGVATCHAVTELDGTKIGNPVDIEMFTATKWQLKEPASTQYVDTVQAPGEKGRVAHVLKRFEFVHARASMSVTVLDPTDNHVHVFVKGSFEKLKETSLPESIPSNYDEITAKLASEGCYVLAMAHKDLGQADIDEVRSWPREKLEEDVGFIGLVVFKNQLKEDTADAITELKQGSTRTVMITGDTALTGIYIAKACNMMPNNGKTYLADVDNSGQVFWVDVDVPHSQRQIYHTRDILPQVSSDGRGNNLELAVTGKAFKVLIEEEVIRDLLLNIRVFARMTPQDKVDCVQLHMERGITAMCGDGGNDCGALRAAHVGIALSEAEASIVSPFSSNHRSVQSCVQLIRQGRAALTTSFAGYKFLIMYGEIMACLKLVSFYFSIQISQPMWILVDAFITVSMSLAVALNKAAPKLAPSRPTARLLGPETLASTLGQIFINFAFIAGAYGLLFKQDFYRCNEFNSESVDQTKWYLLGDNYEAALLAMVSMFQFINAAFVFNYGYLYRRTWFRNYVLVFLFVGFFILLSYILLADPNWLGCTMRINCGNADIIARDYPRPSFNIPKYNIPSGNNIFPRDFRYKLWGYCIANIILVNIWEVLVILGPVRSIFKREKPLPRLKLKL